MRYVLFSVSQRCRVSDLFATEREMWAYVSTQKLFAEVADREDLELQKVLDPRYEIHVCGIEQTA
jgi:hypothetical protein